MQINKANETHIEKIIENRCYFLQQETGQNITSEYRAALREYLSRHIDDCFQMLPSPSNPEGRAGYIKNVNTRKDYRRKGLATQVLTHAIREAEQNGVKVLYLGATKDGLPFYQKLGFRIQQTQMRLEL